jgi:hypothetical protein
MLRGRFSVRSRESGPTRLFLSPDLEWCCVELLVHFTVRAGEMLARLVASMVLDLWVGWEDRSCVHVLVSDSLQNGGNVCGVARSDEDRGAADGEQWRRTSCASVPLETCRRS